MHNYYYTYTFPECMHRRPQQVRRDSLLMIVSPLKSLDAQFEVSPSPVNTYIGHVAEFLCITRSSGIVWTINNNTGYNIPNSIRTRPRSDREPGANSTLRILATQSANNSVIRCTIVDIDTSSEITSSQGVLLKVQGKH